MATARLYQIAYSPEALAHVEPGYLVLDNLANPRPDWYELGPIRRFLHEQGLPDEDAYYGFFSPKFGSKTGLNRAQVQQEIDTAAAASADVVLFSPQPDMGAFFLNVFEQGETFDAGFIAACQAWIAHAGFDVPALGGLVMDTRTTVFSNYFAARCAFWREWLRWIDTLFEAAESGPEAMRSQLTHSTSYPGAAQRKVFIQERVASLILTLQPRWRTHAVNPFRMGWSSGTRFRDHPEMAVMSDALKRAHRDLGYPSYLQAFARLRQRFQQPMALPASLPEPPLTPEAPTDPALTGIPDVEAECQRLFDTGCHADCMAHMMFGVDKHYRSPNVVGTRALFYPALDRQIGRLADEVLRRHPPSPAPSATPSGNTLIIATEVYQVGGHSRVIEDLMRECARPTLLLTDTFQSLQRHPHALVPWLNAFADNGFLVLKQYDPWAKARELWQIVQRLAPDEILYLQHHQDPVPFVGTLRHASSRKALVHHTDHNPSLGGTLPELAHLDFTAEVGAVCAATLQRPIDVLPLYVADGGLKAFEPRALGQFSVVTSGTEVKFKREGPLALSTLVAAALSAVQGSFFHIGPLANDWQVEIREVLSARGIAPERFQAMGPVPSLWKALGALDAHVYIGSAPIGGGRAAIEAQGCGYPLLFYRTPERDLLTAVDSVYADPAWAWSTPEELAQRLRELSPRLPEASRQARTLYDADYSIARFRQVLSRHARLRG
ncbi:MAG: hypothetical protein WCT47_08740 [Betaproteobacteria bacterium]